MKVFANITLEQLKEAQVKLSNMPNAVHSSVKPDYVNWEVVALYIHEFWGRECDNDDLDLIHDNVWFNSETGWVYIIEVYEDAYGVDRLLVETLYA